MVDRARALQHFGSEEVMDSLVARFPATVRATLDQLKDANRIGRQDDLVCLLYQLRGAASWVCADALSDAALAMLDVVNADAPDPTIRERALHCLMEEVERTCKAIEKGVENCWSSTPATQLSGASAPAGFMPHEGLRSKGKSRLDDVHQILDAWEDENSLFHSMARRFPVHFDRTLQRMRRSIEVRDWQALTRRAHSLKCGAAMMGAMQLSGSAAALEMAINDV
jgi:HPt (histidine-containing phosphotransfer) domain-containing protein